LRYPELADAVVLTRKKDHFICELICVFGSNTLVFSRSHHRKYGRDQFGRLVDRSVSRDGSEV
jgi:hypothetical protein